MVFVYEYLRIHSQYFITCEKKKENQNNHYIQENDQASFIRIFHESYTLSLTVERSNSKGRNASFYNQNENCYSTLQIISKEPVTANNIHVCIIVHKLCTECDMR